MLRLRNSFHGTRALNHPRVSRRPSGDQVRGGRGLRQSTPALMAACCRPGTEAQDRPVCSCFPHQKKTPGSHPGIL